MSRLGLRLVRQKVGGGAPLLESTGTWECEPHGCRHPQPWGHDLACLLWNSSVNDGVQAVFYTAFFLLLRTCLHATCLGCLQVGCPCTASATDALKGGGGCPCASALMIKQPCDTSTQVQFTHGPPPGSANKQLVVAGGRPGPLTVLCFYTALLGRKECRD
jgi:hypothetical protein